MWGFLKLPLRPLFRKTKERHYVAFGVTSEGRYLTSVFELKPKGIGGSETANVAIEWLLHEGFHKVVDQTFFG